MAPDNNVRGLPVQGDSEPPQDHHVLQVDTAGRPRALSAAWSQDGRRSSPVDLADADVARYQDEQSLAGGRRRSPAARESPGKHLENATMVRPCTSPMGQGCGQPESSGGPMTKFQAI